MVFEPLGITIIATLVYVIAETGLWAIYLMLFGWALRLQLSTRKLRGLVNIAILIVTIVLFSTSTALWAMNVSILMIILKDFFLELPASPVAKRFDVLYHSVLLFAVPTEGLFLVN
ncbi:hypothetical protein V5O48_013413, partial [Marasmius crinis-equi]